MITHTTHGRTTFHIPIAPPTPVSDNPSPPRRRRGLPWLLGWAMACTLSPGTAGAALAEAHRYDAEDRLLSATVSPGAGANPRRVEYQHDADGLRVGWITIEQGPGGEVRTTNRVLLDPLSPAGMPQAIARTGAGARTYLQGLHPAAEIDSQTGEALYLITDGHLSVRGTADPAGRGTASFDYDAFGVEPGDSSARGPDHRHAGEWFDGDLGAAYLRARWSDPGLGRFLTADSAEGSRRDPPSRHRHLALRNDPVNRVDPGGHADYSLQSFAVASTVSGTLATLDTFVATRGHASRSQLMGSFTHGAIMGAGGYLVAPLFYAAGAGGRLAYNSMALATAVWGFGTAYEQRDAPLLAYRALMLALFSGAADRDPSVRVYRVEGEPDTRVLINDDGEVALRGNKPLYLNFGQRARAEEFLARRQAQGERGVVLKSFEVDGAYLRHLQEVSVPEHLASEYPDRPIQLSPTGAPEQFGIPRGDFERLLDAILKGSGETER